MLMNFVGNYHGDQLGNTGQKEICMERFLILSFTSCNTETIFNMIDRFLDIDSDFFSITISG